MNPHQVKEVMTRLGIGEEQFRALGLVPLIEVAWADGRVNFLERSAVSRFGKRKGWLAEGGQNLVETWLKKPPAGAFFDDAREALAALLKDRRGLGAAFPSHTAVAILCACRDVAAVSGGLFRLGSSIGPEQEEALQRVADALSLGPWRAAVDQAGNVATADPKGPPGHFLLGSLPDFNRDPLGFMLLLMREHGDIAHVRFGPADVYFVSHPDGVKQVLMDNHRNYRLPPSFEDVKEFLGEGLLTTEGEHWRAHRRMIQPAFHMDKLAEMASAMTQITGSDLSRWQEGAPAGEPVNVMEKLMQLTLRVAGVCMFGMDLSDDTTEVLDAAAICLEHMVQRSRQLFRVPISVPIESNRRFVQARSVLDKTVYGLLKARKEGKSAAKADVLQLLLDARDEDTGRGLDEKELRDELLTMMGAGTETTALALMWTCYFLSKNPPIRRAVEAEIDRVLGKRAPTLADLRELPTVKHVIDESMRLRPPFYISGRTAVGEDEIGGLTIKAGSVVIMSVYAMHRHPAIWPNPEGFDPERFLPDASKDRHPSAFLPFSTGPKKCIGMNFANMEMQLVLPMILQRFELRLVPGMEPEPDPSLTLRAKDGCWMTLHPKPE